MPQINGKKAIVVHFENKPIFVYQVQEFNSREFLILEMECKKNLKELLDKKEEEKKELNERIEKLEKEIRIIKGED